MHKKTITTTGDISEFMAHARKVANKSLVSVATKSGFTQQTISNLEKNRGSINLTTLLALTQCIGVKVELSIVGLENFDQRDC